MKLSAVTTHPIQYQAPWFRAVAERKEIDFRVYFGLVPNEEQQGTGFGVPFKWDIPLLEAYPWEVLPSAKPSPSLSGFFANSTPDIYKILARTRPDAVIVTGWQSLPLVQTLWACLRLGIPCIARGESNAMRGRPLPIRLWHRLLLGRFDAFLAIGKSNAEFYRGYGIPSGRIFAAPYFIDNRRFRAQCDPLRDQRRGLRKKWGVVDDRAVFLYVGKLEPKKRILDLLNAAKTASAAGIKLHVLVVGDGRLRKEAEQMSGEAGLPVTFAGFLNQTEITSAYVAADCLVLPSDYGETWGLVVNEAMACGLPAIVSDRVGCGPDLVIPGETGAIFPFGDIAALGRALVEFASRPEELREMGRRACSHIDTYSVDHAVEGTLKALDYVTTRRRP